MEGENEEESGQMGSIHSNNPSASRQHLAVLCRRREARRSP